MASHREHVRRRSEEVDLHLRQPGHRGALRQEAGQRSQDGVLALSLFACNFGNDKLCLKRKQFFLATLLTL